MYSLLLSFGHLTDFIGAVGEFYDSFSSHIESERHALRDEWSPPKHERQEQRRFPPDIISEASNLFNSDDAEEHGKSFLSFLSSLKANLNLYGRLFVC